MGLYLYTLAPRDLFRTVTDFPTAGVTSWTRSLAQSSRATSLLLLGISGSSKFVPSCKELGFRFPLPRDLHQLTSSPLGLGSLYFSFPETKFRRTIEVHGTAPTANNDSPKGSTYDEKEIPTRKEIHTVSLQSDTEGGPPIPIDRIVGTGSPSFSPRFSVTPKPDIYALTFIWETSSHPST
jgi:hypothetical protein